MAKSNKNALKSLRAKKDDKKNGIHKIKSKPLLKNKKRKSDDMEDVELDVVDKVIQMKHSERADESIPEGGKEKVGSVKKHKNELMDLENTDPEFFKFLQENDAGLLNFGEDEEDQDDDDELDDDDLDDFAGESDSDDEEAGGKSKGRKSKKDRGNVEVTDELLTSNIKKANSKSGSLTSLRKLLSMFKTACVPPNNDDEDGEDAASSARYFIINSPEMYENVMTKVIDVAHVVFYKILALKDTTQEGLSTLEKNPNFKKSRPLILSYFKSILHTLDSLSNTINQGQVSAFLINSLENYIPLAAALPRVTKAILKVLLAFWSKDLPIQEDTHNIRGHAFLRIRQMAIQLPGIVMEECFRSMYLTYSRTAKNFSELTSSSVVFMAQCITELFKADAVQAYQQAFLYIRQLALHLRTAVVKQTGESVRQVTTWQFLNCVRLWTRVICEMPSTDELGALAFPLVQIIFGMMSVAPSLYFIPLRLHLITCLQQLSVSCKIFIPTASRLVEILEHPDLSSKPTPSTEVAPKLAHLVKLPPDSLTKVVFRDTIVQETVSVLRNDAEVYRYNVGLPEYFYLTTRKLRAISKKFKVSKWRDLLKTVVGQMDQYSTFVKVNRVKLQVGCAEINEFESLLPKGAPECKQRLLKLMASKEMVTEVASAAEQSKMSQLQSQKKVQLKFSNSDSMLNGDEENNADEIVSDRKTAVSKKSKKTKKQKKPVVDRDTEEVVGNGDVANIKDLVSTFEWSDDENDNSET